MEKVKAEWSMICTAHNLRKLAARCRMTERDAIFAFKPTLNGQAPRKQAAKELAAQGMSQRQIAKVVGADQKTISNDLREENSSKSEENSSPAKPATKAEKRAQREAELAAKVKYQRDGGTHATSREQGAWNS